MSIELRSPFTPQTLVLTATLRLANFLQNQYDKELSKTQPAWQTPAILPLSAWCQQCFELYPDLIAPNKRLFTAIDSFDAWAKILEQDEQADLLNREATITLAQSASNTLCQWQMTLHQSDIENDQQQRFSQWLMQYQQQKQDLHGFDHSELLTELIHALKNIPLPYQQVYFAGFDELTPQLEALQRQFDARDIACAPLHNPNINLTAFRTPLSNTETEIQTMALWAKQLLDTDPNLHIACIVPRLPQLRDRIEQVFLDVFYPNHSLPSVHIFQPLFNISAAKPLSQFPIIATALNLLELLKPKTTLPVWDNLCHSPFLANGETEYFKRSALAAILHETGNEWLTGKEVLALASRKRVRNYSGYCPLLCASLTEQLEISTTPTNLAEWCHRFLSVLSIFGWPGERTLNSHAFQLTDRFYRLLQLEFPISCHTTPRYSLSHALERLSLLCNKCLFQFKSGVTQIEILGTLEASGLCFDFAWLMDCHDGIWPASATPNPLLPLKLQRKYNMPHASPFRELAFAQSLTNRILTCATHVMVSYPISEAEVSLRPSQLISHLPERDPNQLALAAFQSLSERIAKTADLDYYHDPSAVPRLSNEKITGGSHIFKLQAACPFRAFAEIRCQAVPIAEPYPGMNAMERGAIVHRILETLWQTIQSHQTLVALPLQKLNALICDHIEAALAKFHQDFLRLHSEYYYSLEKQRLLRIFQAWFELEKSREPFWVMATEQRNTVTIESLTINISLDRIDQLHNGTFVIIDYKTGKPHISAWFGDRPDEPQLPLYCLTSSNPISGILFAELRSDGVRYRGILEDDATSIPGTTPLSKVKESDAITFTELKRFWQTTLSQLASQFQQGITTVDPKNPITTCQYCHCQPLCRIFELEEKASRKP